MNDDIQHFRAQCFLFACGKLEPADAAWMEAMLVSHPELREEVEADRALASIARDTLDAQPATPPLLSFEQIARELDARSAKQTTHTSSAAAWQTRIAAWWSGLARTPASGRGAWAVAAAAVLAVITTIQVRQSERADVQPSTEYRSLEPGADQQTGTLEVVFNDTLTAGDLRQQLPELHMRILSGPDDKGAYRIAVLEGPPAQALQLLQQRKMVREGKVLDPRDRMR
jgi:hypothetical protein